MLNAERGGSVRSELETDLAKKFYEPRVKTVSLTIRMPPSLHEMLKRAAELQTAIEKEVGEGTVSLNDTCLRALEVALDSLCEEFKVDELPTKDTKEFSAVVERAARAHKAAHKQ